MVETLTAVSTVMGLITLVVVVTVFVSGIMFYALLSALADTIDGIIECIDD